jgi:hypothetical protein
LTRLLAEALVVVQTLQLGLARRAAVNMNLFCQRRSDNLPDCWWMLGLSLRRWHADSHCGLRHGDL